MRIAIGQINCTVVIIEHAINIIGDLIFIATVDFSKRGFVTG